MEVELQGEYEEHGIDNDHGAEAEGEDQAVDVHHGEMVEPARLPPDIDLKRAQAKKDEIRQLFEDKADLRPMLRHDVPAGKMILNEHIFTVDKFEADGAFDKCKSRMVANGSEQDKELYPDRSSPTADVYSLIICIALASMEGKTFAKIDVRGAYLNAVMTGEPVYMRLSKGLTKLAVEAAPELEKFVENGVFKFKLV